MFVHIKQNNGGGNKLIDKLGVMINTLCRWVPLYFGCMVFPYMFTLLDTVAHHRPQDKSS